MIDRRKFLGIAAGAGAGLALSGAALQGLFRNPLVDPGIIGVTAGAGFGGTLAILLVGGGTVVLGAAFGCGMLSLLVVRFLATVKGRTSTLTFVLAGVIVSAFFEACMASVMAVFSISAKPPPVPPTGDAPGSTFMTFWAAP